MKKKIIIFGCGFHGRAVYRKCKILKKKYEIIGWIDNDKKKINKQLFDIKIFSVNSINNIKYDYIIISGRNVEEKIKQIKKINKKSNFLLWDNSKIKPTKKQIERRDKSLSKILNDVLKNLENHNVNYWIDSSALLTVIRKDNLSIRSDFDIAVDINHFKIVKQLFKTTNFYTFHRIKLNKNKIKCFFVSKDNYLNFEPAVVDIVFKDLSKNKYVYDFLNYKKKYPKYYFLKFRYIKYKNFEFKIPYDTKSYLKYLYGNWKLKDKFYKNILAKKKPYLFHPFIKTKV